MDGHLNAAFFEDADTQPDKLCSWQRLRPVCFSIIKGKQPPVSFQITFFLEKDKASNLFNDSMLANNQDIDGFTLHLSYRNHTLSLSTGTVFSRFSLDRDSERLWDHYVAAWIIGGSTYCTREHDSLKISNGKWCWFSRGIGGYSALDYLIKVKEMPFTQAVETIMGNLSAAPPAFVPAPKMPKEKVLLLP